MKIIHVILHLLWIAVLTALTQVGGIIWIISLIIAYHFNKKKRYVFPLTYLVFNLMIIPPIAKISGREKLPVFSNPLHAQNIMYALMFRNYVTPDLRRLLISASEELYPYGIAITYLDANFPFIDGFPLWPHLSHNDGKKIDIAFMYLDSQGTSTLKKPSLSGYGVYVDSQNPMADYCANNGHWQYDFPKYLTFGTLRTLSLDQPNTILLIKQLLKKPSTEKIFIEPYLKQQLGLSGYSKIRFHGCKAVRHDDHIHLQIK